MIVDGHNDYVLRVWQQGPIWHVDLDAAAEAGFAGGFFAMFVPSDHSLDMREVPYSLPLPEPIPAADAIPIARELFETLEGLPVAIATSPSDFSPERVTAIAHFEGAEAIEPDLSNLEDWYARGLRSIGIVWSRANDFAEGVPFRYPSSPDTGPGLTDAGRGLVQACNRLGILVDLSHLNEAGFWDVAEVSHAPLVATHSNAHALCPVSRNLTDEQLDAVGKSGGVVGINFAVGFLREDGSQDPASTPLTEIVRHVDYVAKRIGVDHVAFGSDFDGTVIPGDLEGVAGLPKLVEALRDAGYDDAAVDKITYGNWLRVLGDTWA